MDRRKLPFDELLTQTLRDGADKLLEKKFKREARSEGDTIHSALKGTESPDNDVHKWHIRGDPGEEGWT